MCKLLFSQTLPIGIKQAWEFFSIPQNLSLITPKQMNFEILSASGGDKIHAGQIIKYKVTVFPFARILWESEITEVEEGVAFTDTQRRGPYSTWTHRHTFMEIDGGVEMTDELEYVVPFGPIGELGQWLFVDRAVQSIFEYRSKVLKELFQDK